MKFLALVVRVEECEQASWLVHAGRAVLAQGTFGTERTLRLADSAAVQNEPVMQWPPKLRHKLFAQRLLHLSHILSSADFKAPRHPKDMRIHRQCVLDA